MHDISEYHSEFCGFLGSTPSYLSTDDSNRQRVMCHLFTYYIGFEPACSGSSRATSVRDTNGERPHKIKRSLHSSWLWPLIDKKMIYKCDRPRFRNVSLCLVKRVKSFHVVCDHFGINTFIITTIKDCQSSHQAHHYKTSSLYSTIRYRRMTGA